MLAIGYVDINSSCERIDIQRTRVIESCARVESTHTTFPLLFVPIAAVQAASLMANIASGMLATTRVPSLGRLCTITLPPNRSAHI